MAVGKNIHLSMSLILLYNILLIFSTNIVEKINKFQMRTNRNYT